MRESNSAPSRVIRISWTLTDQPAWNAGVEKANVANMNFAVIRIPRAVGGRTECDLRVYINAAPKALSLFSDRLVNLYNEMNCVAVMVIRYDEQHAAAEMVSSEEDDGVCVYAGRKDWLSSANSKTVNEPSSKPTTTL